ncbi:betaine--homocysteine S-methyltransferase 1-like [Clytia hemisphaerica]|uniref:Hcy-binding domain-containing protein n=1 Tax=Clytia hemisphaerica TaxID=252671 RepID=A0A7M5UKG6_9CNID|eukprot:TCONS_00022982-protein
MAKNILDRLNEGEVIIGDGGYTHELEQRGYVTSGLYTPEVVVEHPSAVKELHKEFALSGADVLQAFVFYGNDDKLNNGRNESNLLNGEEINNAGCQLVSKVAKDHGCFVALPLVTTEAYSQKKGKELVQKEFLSQINIFKNYEVDLLISEFMSSVEEAEWAIEVMKTLNKPIASTLCIDQQGDQNGISLQECALRLAKAGADIIGVNCRYEPSVAVESIRIMKEACEKESLNVHYMTQPCGYRTADAPTLGMTNVPEAPLAMESRQISRWEAQKFAREAYEAGVRYIGGCCGFKAYHIRAMAEELSDITKKLPQNSRSKNAESLKHHRLTEFQKRANKDYWYNLAPKDGRKAAA